MLTETAPNLTRLSPSVSFYRPEPDSYQGDENAPKLIFLATWMDARDVHIKKYVARYHAIYPAASILVAKSYFWYYFSPSAARRDITPAVSIIRDIIDSDDNSDIDLSSSSPRMLIHLFSNGGSCMLYHLYDVYKKGRLPLHVTIFDSAPGRWSHSVSTRAILAGVPVGWARTLAFPFAYLVGMWWLIKYSLLKVPQETHVWGLAHNDPARAHEAGRSYVYSETDEFVADHDVEEHADHAEINGYKIVRRDKFQNSDHVAHARSDPDRYWSLVTDTWEASNEKGGR
jgi:hypothetical protein